LQVKILQLSDPLEMPKTSITLTKTVPAKGRHAQEQDGAWGDREKNCIGC